MVAMNPGIILAGQAPDVIGSMARGAQAGQFVNEARHQNALRAAIAQHGAGLVSGDAGARNALAGFDPGMVMQADAHRQSMDHNEQRLQLAYQQAQRQAQELGHRMSEAERQQELERLNRGIAMGTQAQTPEQWDQIMQSVGAADLVGQFENRNVIVAGALGVRDALSMGQDGSTQAFQTLHQRALAAGLHPGTPEYQQFMAQGGRSETDSAREQQIARLMEGGVVDRDTAIGIVDGRLRVERDPVTRELSIVDLGRLGAEGGPVVYDSGAPRRSAAGDATQPGTTMPGDVDFSEATGLSGAASNWANTLSDMVGMGSTRPNVEAATQALGNLQNQTMIALTDAVPGRPSNFLLERFERLTVTPNSLLMGQDRARERLNQTRSMIAEAIQMNEDILRAQATPQMRAEAEVSNIRLRRLLNDYDHVIQSFGARQDGQQPTPDWMLNTDPRTWTSEQMDEAERIWGLGDGR